MAWSFPERPRRGVCVTDSVLKDSNRKLRALAMDRDWAYRRMVAGADEPYEPVAALERAHVFTDWLSGHDLVVTGRFHTVTLCIATGTPFVAVESNTFKISAFVQDVFGDSRRVIAPEALEGLQPEMWGWSAREVEAVKAAQMTARAAQVRMFARLAQSVPETRV